MRKVTKFAVLALTLIMSLSLVACGKDEGSSDSSDGAAITGTPIETSELKTMVPSGWTGLEVKDLFSSDGAMDPEQLQIIKGGSTEEDAYKCNFVKIIYSPPSKTLTSAKSLYDDAQDIDSFEKAGYSWTGYTCTSMGYGYTIIEGKKGDEQLQVTICTKSGESTINFDDADVQYIIENIKTTPPSE